MAWPRRRRGVRGHASSPPPQIIRGRTKGGNSARQTTGASRQRGRLRGQVDTRGAVVARRVGRAVGRVRLPGTPNMFFWSAQYSDPGLNEYLTPFSLLLYACRLDAAATGQVPTRGEPNPIRGHAETAHSPFRGRATKASPEAEQNAPSRVRSPTPFLREQEGAGPSEAVRVHSYLSPLRAGCVPNHRRGAALACPICTKLLAPPAPVPAPFSDSSAGIFGVLALMRVYAAAPICSSPWCKSRHTYRTLSSGRS